MTQKSHRDTIALEDARIIEHQKWPDGQYIMRLHSPRCAAKAQPGSFVHITVSDERAMRRPLSIMRVDSNEGWIELLYKVVGDGTRLLAQRRQGETLSILGPIGNPFVLHSEKSRPLLLGGGVGIPPMIFIADEIRKQQSAFKPTVFLGSESPFPLKTAPSSQKVSGLQDAINSGLEIIENMGFASRLASLQNFTGCFQGYITDLAETWLSALSDDERQQVEIFSCGPHPMLEAVAKLAKKHQLPCQVSLEEYMACAVGGCAGCVVEVKTPQGSAMKRVCVDGPVFEAATVF